jgi:hypothetical protein
MGPHDPPRRLRLSDVESALSLLDTELNKLGKTEDIILIGSVVMMIDLHVPDEVETIETYFWPDYDSVSTAAIRVADKKNYPRGWISSASAGITYIFSREPLSDAANNVWREFRNLRVYRAPLEYVFVLKIMSNRPGDDALWSQLMTALHLSSGEEVISLISQYVPGDYITPDLISEMKWRFG